MEAFLEQYKEFGFERYQDPLFNLVEETRTFLDQAGGNYAKHRQVFEEIPDLSPSRIDLGGRFVTAGSETGLEPGAHRRLEAALKRLSPWRKGPFDFFGVKVDAEWQSWMKWSRLVPHLPDLKYKRILDIGSSNGYYMFRMAAHAPQFVLGVEPQSAFYYQYLTARKLLKQDRVFCLPVPYDRLPPIEQVFDLVFCMGILYHRKSPLEMLSTIHDSLKPGGYIILENLVLEGTDHRCLFPKDRYAKMRNVFFIPDLAVMGSWLERSGFKDIQCVDVTRTSCEEQRKTDWVQTESLKDFLDPENPMKTVEGYPAPVRAVFIARA